MHAAWTAGLLKERERCSAESLAAEIRLWLPVTVQVINGPHWSGCPWSFLLLLLLPFVPVFLVRLKNSNIYLLKITLFVLLLSQQIKQSNFPF